LEACTRVGLISICLDKLPQVDNVISDLIVELLSVLTNYSITVKETKHFLRALYACDGVWVRQLSLFNMFIYFICLLCLEEEFVKIVKCNARNA
jgi:hypothetical protein